MPLTRRAIVMAARPQGLPRPADFAIVEQALPALEDGRFLIRHDWLGLPPAARLRMNAEASYTAPQAIGETMHGQAVGEVIASRHDGFPVGTPVLSVHSGWATHSVSTGASVHPIDPALAPPSVWLGALGSSGQTAWVGLVTIGALRAGDTVVVSSAAGAVGSMAAQIARLLGARVVGIAGGAEKCALAVADYGCVAAADHRSPDFAAELAAACGGGVDLYFDNVGGAVRDAVWPLMARDGRVVVCGLISEYNSGFVRGPEWYSLLTKRLTVRGFIMSDHPDQREAFVARVGGWYRDGLIRVREDVVDGLEQAPAAFIRMLQGGNRGKALVQLAPPSSG